MSQTPRTGTAPDAIAPPPWVARVGLAALVLLIGAQLFGLLASSPDRDMGHLQKIMYVHVPAAWNTMIAFVIVFFGSVMYLWKRDEKWDRLAVAAAEPGVVLCALTLALGSIWGRPTWGVWWTWDPRLTTTAIMLVLYAGYLALRSFTEVAERRARWSAAVGIMAFLNVPIVYFSVRWWRTIHQVQSSPSTVDATYAWGLRLNAIAILLVLVYFMARRYHVARLEALAEERYEQVALGERKVAYV